MIAVSALVVGAMVAIAISRLDLGDTIKEITLPLRHDDIIRQQAAEKDLDPALIAAVIYSESRFNEGRRSSAGAIGLMQVTPQTAQVIEHLSGGTTFVTQDLKDPEINIRYGSYYLRYLLDRYDGNEVLAVAAYNGGETNVDRWLADSRERGEAFSARDIPFPETRAYVDRVLSKRQEYRDNYASELGL